MSQDFSVQSNECLRYKRLDSRHVRITGSPDCAEGEMPFEPWCSKMADLPLVFFPVYCRDVDEYDRRESDHASGPVYY
jgi:hypothetical protein